MRDYIALLLLLSLLAGTYLEQVSGCTAIGITKGATLDGTSLLAHTDDSGGEAGDVRVVPVPRIQIDISKFDPENGKYPLRPVYNFVSGYPRIVTEDRGKYYKPAGFYNGQKLKEVQSVFTPLGFIDDISPVEILKTASHGKEKIITLNKKREDDEWFRYAYYDQDYGMMNEMQLSIVESTCGAKTVGWPNNLDYGYSLFGIAELSKIALERCITARCACLLMGRLAEEYGFFSEDSGTSENPGYGDSAEGLVVGDRLGEVWSFHILTGEGNASAIWAAQRVPNGEITVIANGFNIREIDFEDDDNFLYSKAIRDVARNLGFWNGHDGDDFDFTKVFSWVDPTPITPLYVGRRVWRIFDFFAPSLALDSTIGWSSTAKTYPFSVRPDEPVNLTDVFDILKDYYQGTIYDMTKGIAAGPFGNPNRFSVGNRTQLKNGAWERPISIWRGLFSFVCQIAGDDGIRSILWYGPDKPHGTVYLPLLTSTVQAPAVLLTGMQSQFDFVSAWRAFNFMNNWAMLRYDSMSSELKKYQNELQEAAIKLVSAKVSDKELESQVLDFAQNVVQKWWGLLWQFVARFSDGYDTTGEGPGQQVSLGYPDWWLNMTTYVTWPGDSYHPPQQFEDANPTQTKQKIPSMQNPDEGFILIEV